MKPGVAIVETKPVESTVKSAELKEQCPTVENTLLVFAVEMGKVGLTVTEVPTPIASLEGQFRWL